MDLKFNDYKTDAISEEQEEEKPSWERTFWSNVIGQISFRFSFSFQEVTFQPKDLIWNSLISYFKTQMILILNFPVSFVLWYK